MRDLFAVPWLTPSRPTLLGVVVLAILVFGAFALLKSTSDGTQAPATEIITGSIPRAAPVRKSPSDDQMAAFLSPASTQLITLVQRTAVACRSAAAPATQTAVISRHGCGCRISHTRPGKPIHNDSGLPQGPAGPSVLG